MGVSDQWGGVGSAERAGRLAIQPSYLALASIYFASAPPRPIRFRGRTGSGSIALEISTSSIQTQPQGWDRSDATRTDRRTHPDNESSRRTITAIGRRPNAYRPR